MIGNVTTLDAEEDKAPKSKERGSKVKKGLLEIG
jgi:hypothetical protein